ncbi:uncharacterized protein UDID_17665 [Ustilago sp. UG-2017a]|nr:uncharacterized protein UDID_17665 [Ustilago sp. UG-2017a]
MVPKCNSGGTGDKAAALTALRRWITRMEQATDRKLKTLRSDNGGEWCSLGAEDWCHGIGNRVTKPNINSYSGDNWQTQEGFKWQKSVPGISVQNGRAERVIRSVQEKMRSMLIGQTCPRELWLYAITAAAHMMNLTPSATKTIPHKKDQQGKYRARAKPAIMIGYNDKHKAWKFWNPDQPASIQWSNSATFHEDKGWSDCQQEAVRPMVTAEVEEEGVMPAIVEEETRSEAAVEDLLPAVDSTVGAANTAVLNLDPTLGEAMNSEDAQCHGPGCSGSRRVTGSYGRSIGIGELVDTSREHGCSAVSMETMDSYGFTCKGGPGPYARRARHEEDQAQRSRHSHAEDQAQGAGTATKGTKLKEHADGYHSGARETRAKGTITGQREGAVYRKPASRS